MRQRELIGPNASKENPAMAGTVNARNLYSLAAALIPKRGTKTIRSDKVRQLARKAFRRPRAR
jgi:hypothetical protein